MAIGTLVIRADASPEIGTGHVMRCLALAEEWRDQGGNVVFAMAESTPSVRTRLTAEFEVVAVHGKPGTCKDAVNTSLIAQKLGSKWLVLDGYRLDYKYQQAVQESGSKVLVIDDIASAESYCADMILNQNVHADDKMYRNRRSSTKLLLGTKFVLLRHEFAHKLIHRYKVREAGRRVLITMGGSDPCNISGRILRAFESIVVEGLEVIVVAGPANFHVESLRTLIATSTHKVHLAQDPKSLLELMLWTDMAVSAAGSTIWELCRVGVPSLLITFAENQCSGARELAQRAIAVNLGDAEEVNDRDIAREITDMLLSYQRRRRMSELGSALVDGAGRKRVVAAMRGQYLKLRLATMSDCTLLFDWVNDPKVRAASFQSERISRDEHLAWFSEKLRCGHVLIYIAEDAGGTPVGQFRVDCTANGSALLDVTVAPEKRGLGLAEKLIREGIEVASRERGLRSFDAYIKAENTASWKAFQKAGFHKAGELPNSTHWRKEVGRG
jgi:UDP-2,4-diacetamido-2,4,6-trideoxy-beta-L-altropyranose hydrolase